MKKIELYFNNIIIYNIIKMKRSFELENQIISILNLDNTYNETFHFEIINDKLHIYSYNPWNKSIFSFGEFTSYTQALKYVENIKSEHESECESENS